MKKYVVLFVCLFALLSMNILATTIHSTTTTTYNVVAHAKPAAGLAGAGVGLCDNGAHLIKVAYVTANGINTLSAASDAVTVVDKAADGKIAVTVVASPNPSVTSVNIYMTIAAGADYFLAVSGVANANGATNVSVADTSLTVPAPTTDTSAVDTVITTTAGTMGYVHIKIRNQDGAVPLYFTLDGTTVSTSTSFYIAGGGDDFDWWYETPRTLGDVSKQVTLHLRSTTAAVSASYIITQE